MSVNLEMKITKKYKMIKMWLLHRRKSILKRISSSTNKILRMVFEDIIIAFFVGVAVVIATEYIGEIRHNRDIDRSLQLVALGESEEYLIDVFGVPIITYRNMDGLYNSYFKEKDFVLRCVFDEDKSLVAYILTTSRKNLYLVESEHKYLLSFTYNDYNEEALYQEYECNVPATNDDYAYYQEKYYGAAPADYSYFILGNYRDYRKNSKYDEMLVYHFNKQFNKNSLTQEYYNIRKRLIPNTYGMIKGGYEDKIDIIDHSEEVGIYGHVLYEL